MLPVHLAVYTFGLILIMFHSAFSLCPVECNCRDEPTSCPAGVSLVTDGCDCCKVCARQLDQQCNEDGEVCDVHRNLYCDFMASRSGDWGICKSRSGRPCWNGEDLVRSGSSFEPSCKKTCWCIDGAVGCIPVCPHEAKIPRPDRCPNARLESEPGECCERWTCNSSSGEVFTLPLDDFWNEYVNDQDEDTESTSTEISNGVREGTIYEDDIGEGVDELRDYQLPLDTISDDSPDDREMTWHQNNIIPGDSHAQLHSERSSREGNSRCQHQASPWSLCSKSCGLGVSTRVSNNNPNCRLVREQRLCQTRPCNNTRYVPKKGRHCLRHRRSRKPATLKYAGCFSLRKIRLRYCGGCHDQGKCCTPKATRNIRIRFQCKDGHIFTKNIAAIKSCHCHRNCASITPSNQHPVGFALFGDMHRSQAR